MNIQLIIAFFTVLQLRKSFHTKTQYPFWNKVFLRIMYACIALQAIEISFHRLSPITIFLSFVIILGIAGIIYVEQIFEDAKPTMLAILPVIVVSFVVHTLQFISTKLFDSWNGFFDFAQTIAFIWMGTQLLINRKQRRALEKERLKTHEEERQNKIMATLKSELEVQVAERTAEITTQKEALEHALADLKSAQAQLIQSEKLASLGELTAGIAHEIQNPLNFVNNFSEVNTELIEEMKHEIEKGNFEEVKAIANDIKANELKISHHGKRADAIVKGMLHHSRSSSGVKEPTDINALADEYLRLSYHGLRAKDKSFNATLKTEFDESIKTINIIPQDIGRVILNLITNAFYAVAEKKKEQPEGYEPTVTVKTLSNSLSPGRATEVRVSVKDNGNGIPKKVMDKIFQPFFTTKPTGQGTGLGLSLSYDIVKAHGGEFEIHTEEGKYTEFVFTLPITPQQ
jgi:two-component system, NtrC family, sensor kinase